MMDPYSGSMGFVVPTSNWTTFERDERGFWFRWRMMSNGEKAFDYRYDSEFGSPSPQPAPTNVPRSEAANSLSQSNIRFSSSPSDSRKEESYTYGPVPSRDSPPPPLPSASGANRDYNQGSDFQSNTDWNQESAATEPAVSSSDPAHDSLGMRSGQSQQPTYPNQPRGNQSFRQTFNPNSVDDAAEELGELSLGRQENSNRAPNYGNPSTSPRTLNSPVESRNYWQLDPRYKTIEKSKLKSFWKVGRVFLTLWIEPAGDGHRVRGDASQFTKTGYLDGIAYSEIRRFVVLCANYGNAQCSPIHTYSNYGTLKPNLPDVGQHAIIYTSRYPPKELLTVDSEGNTVAENLKKDPIRVVSELSGNDGKLSDCSRLNYSKLYTVEFYAKVVNIGMVHPDSMAALTKSSFVRPRDDPPQPPKGSRHAPSKKPGGHRSGNSGEPKNAGKK